MARNAYYKSKHWLDLRTQVIRRDHGLCTIAGCPSRGTHVDHIRTRPNCDAPTPYDTIGNLRLLCAYHDGQLKERRYGKRKAQTTVTGVDANGYPIDPNHPWRT